MGAFIKGFSEGSITLLILGLFALLILPFSSMITALLELLAWIVVIAIIAMIIGSILNSSL